MEGMLVFEEAIDWVNIVVLQLNNVPQQELIEIVVYFLVIVILVYRWYQVKSPWEMS